jgi:hypothetical protein
LTVEEDDSQPLASGPERAVSEDEARAAAQPADPADVTRMAQAAPITKRHTNIDQTAIEVTEDRARLVLSYTIGLNQRGRDWMGPAGLFLGLLLGVLTSDFKPLPMGVAADTVKGMAILATLTTGVWTAVATFHALRSPSSKHLIDETIEKLKYHDAH